MRRRRCHDRTRRRRRGRRRCRWRRGRRPRRRCRRRCRWRDRRWTRLQVGERLSDVQRPLPRPGMPGRRRLHRGSARRRRHLYRQRRLQAARPVQGRPLPARWHQGLRRRQPVQRRRLHGGRLHPRDSRWRRLRRWQGVHPKRQLPRRHVPRRHVGLQVPIGRRMPTAQRPLQGPVVLRQGGRCRDLQAQSSDGRLLPCLDLGLSADRL